jgi:cyclopropane-fatty-acyl-phospholipid synthase
MRQPLQKLIASRYDGRDIPVALVLPDGGRVTLSKTPEINIYARTWNGLRALAWPELGRLARAYVHDDIDFTGEVRRVLGVAEALVGTVVHGRDRATARLKHWWHVARGNKTNIQHHYDVSNAFYRMWLDERMVYSCAYFKTAGDTLDQAQAQKLDHICRKLVLKQGESLLDIGCGWGGLIMHAAEHYGVDATGITLSQNQVAYAKERIAKSGLGDRCRAEIRDYRSLSTEDAYDKIASVGMVEHVGLTHLPVYFESAYRALKPGGLFLNHGIVSLGEARPKSPRERIFRKFWKADAFIDTYVFPDGKLTATDDVIAAAEATGFEVRDVESLREHYAMTLRHWVRSLEENSTQALALVGNHTFRVWRLYMAASANSFARAAINIIQTLLAKPDARGHSNIPLTREDLYADS